MNVLHETELATAITAINQGLDIADKVGKKVDKAINSNSNKTYFSSISSATRNLILEFPVMITNTVSISTANMISKAIERNCITMLHLLLSATCMSAADAYDVISKVHANLKSNYNLDDFINVSNNLIESGEIKITDQEAYKMLKEDMKNIFTVLPDSLSETSLNDYSINETLGTLMVMKEARFDNNELFTNINSPYYGYTPSMSVTQFGQYHKTDTNGVPLYIDPKTGVEIPISQKDLIASAKEIRDSREHEWRDADYYDKAQKYADDHEKYLFDRRQRQRMIDHDNEKQDFLRNQDRRASEKQNWDREKHGWDRERAEMDRERFNMQVKSDNRAAQKHSQDMLRGDIDMKRNFLLDTDVKKSNELTPSLMIAKFRDPNNNAEQAFVMGVKARLIPVTSADIMDRIISKNKDKNGFLNLIRATTREISFVKDFILAIDKAKVDAIANSRRGSSNPMWKVLERRAIKKNWNKFASDRNNKKYGADCIATLVISEMEADQIKKIANFDISKVNEAKKIMDAYSLMCFVIVDELSESVKFLFDGSDYFETLSFNNLERENGGNKDYKKIVNLLAKNNR